MAYAVEPIFPQLVLLCNLWIDRICPDGLGDCGVEGRVEVCNVFRVRKSHRASFDDGESAGVMEWCQIREVLEMVEGILINDMCRWIVSSVDHAVACMRDIISARYLRKSLIVHQMVQYMFAGILIRLYTLYFLVFNFLRTALVGQSGWRRSKAVNVRIGKQYRRLVGGIGSVDGDFDGGGSGIDGEDDGHGGGKKGSEQLRAELSRNCLPPWRLSGFGHSKAACLSVSVVVVVLSHGSGRVQKSWHSD